MTCDFFGYPKRIEQIHRSLYDEKQSTHCEWKRFSVLRRQRAEENFAEIDALTASEELLLEIPGCKYFYHV